MKLTTIEITEISKITEKLRPQALDNQRANKEIDSKERLILFIHAFEFVSSIVNIIENTEIINKFKLILNESKTIYIESLKLINLSNKEIWSKWRVMNKIENLVIKNMEEINNLIDFTKFLGKKVKLYNPEEHGGVQETFVS